MTARSDPQAAAGNAINIATFGNVAVRKPPLGIAAKPVLRDAGFSGFTVPRVRPPLLSLIVGGAEIEVAPGRRKACASNVR
ncbi:MAG: hypothetical protein L0219_20030 [Phycisphaerales bacterium]|nr:hypothetical protein [Phycisphaerales bacterium]